MTAHCRGRAAARQAVAMVTIVAVLAVLSPAARAAEQEEPGAEADTYATPTTDNDPLRAINRPIFAFNEAADRYVLEPVARGYDFLLPDRVQGWVNNFFWNLRFPMVATNCLLQGKPDEAITSMSRFIINTSVGVLGFGDPATRLGMPQPWEDFGQTLGVWGVPTGPYLVLPLFGPSNFRDGVGIAADSAARIWPYYVDWWVSLGVSLVEGINLRSVYLDEVEQARERALDYYVFTRDAYLQRRQALIDDRLKFGEYNEYSAPPPAAGDDLYTLPEEN
ncbi:MAG TPA: VacJ family lipoprotein [Candidatus Limnocylindrales bacterium]|nr:VacJ family lipoprotein [Candidatus Limnocylindrales bacterium]